MPTILITGAPATGTDHRWEVLADRILVQRGGVTGIGVIADGQAHVVRTRRVVLCAGAYCTPAILQRSGIGPARLLRALSIQPTADLPGVGENLLDHSCIQLDFAGTDVYCSNFVASLTCGIAGCLRSPVILVDHAAKDLPA
jgi:choline dehydrogenase-like flavoprotein